jgi:release factor glutamine methyltransferase
MMNDVWTIARVLQWTTGYFEEKAFESARLDAELLISDALGLDRVGLYMNHHQPLQPSELSLIRERVRRRAAHEPVAYIIGKRAFYDIELKVDSRVLVPRPETEHLVERALKSLADIETARVVDVGCGSGCIALSIAKARPDDEVVGVDISADALDNARQNASDLDLGRVLWREADLLLGVDGPFDFILSNPPYIASADIEELMADVRAFEPRLALDGGTDGLDLYRRLAVQAYERLEHGGTLMVEIGHDQGPSVSDIFRSCAFEEVVVHQDYAGLDRVVVGRRSAP